MRSRHGERSKIGRSKKHQDTDCISKEITSYLRRCSLQEAHEAPQWQPAITRAAHTTNTPKLVKPSGDRKDMATEGGGVS